MIKQLSDGRWLVDIEPVKGRRHRKRFATKGEAKRFEAHIRNRYATNPDWAPPKKDTRRLKDLVDTWYLLHGQTLTDGERRRNSLYGVCERLGNPVAAKLTGNKYTEERGKALKAGTSGKTLNNQLGYLRAVYNELFRLEEIDYPNPLARVRMLKLQERELSYLSVEEIEILFKSIQETAQLPHAYMVALVCLSTGCRWGEAQALTPGRVKNGSVTFVNTKSKRTRTIPISEDLEARLHAHFREHGLFSNCAPAFEKALKRSGIQLPKGQATHVLRHTFASHFMMKGGNILTLQKILGHSSLAMTMRYAHLSPDHLKDAVSFSPAEHIFGGN
ncbi:tyrosine-type recombinase/integrase [Alcanivoracaceae bacterium MT1]